MLCGVSHPRVRSYHDWEHFSSIRNLRGPHAGLPNVQEVAVDGEESTSASDEEQDGQWWWDGWEESHDDDSDCLSTEDDEGEDQFSSFARHGRPRARRQNAFSVTL